MQTRHETYMAMALEESRAALREGELPFGAVIVDRAGEVVGRTHDTVARDGDNSSHAETMLVKQVCRDRGPELSGCTVYTTTEPCPMCFTAMWLAWVSRVVYATTMDEVTAYTHGAVRELTFPARLLNEHAGSRIELISGVLREECLHLFDEIRSEAANSQS